MEFELIMEAELNQQKVFCTKAFEGSNEEQLIELNEFRTLRKKSLEQKKSEKTVFGNLWLCRVNM